MDHEGIRPDMLVLGKALSGGTIPVSVNHMIHIITHTSRVVVMRITVYTEKEPRA